MSEFNELSEHKEYPRLDNKYLTLYEQRYIGGSERIDDVFYDLNQFEKDYLDGKGSLPNIYEKTMAEIRGEIDPQRIDEERKKGYIVGALSFFGESGMDVLDMGFETAIELTGRNAGTIHLIPKRIGLTEKDVAKALSTLTPYGKFSRFLHIEQVGQTLQLRNKTWEEYNEV